MATQDKKVNIFLKKFLTQQQITENFLDYLEKLTQNALFRSIGISGVFEPSPTTTTLISSSVDVTFDIITPLIGTDGIKGNILSLDPLLAAQISFENTVAVSYFVGLRSNVIPSGTEVNVRTSEIKYTFLEEAIGELAEPDSVVDDLDQTLTIKVDSVFEVGVSNAGRTVRVWLKQAVSEVGAFEDVVVQFIAGENIIETTSALGQIIGQISVDASDYQVFAIGPTVRRNTDLRLDPDILFLNIITGTGSPSQPSVFNQSDVNDLSLGLGGLIGLFGIEHSLVDGLHKTLTTEVLVSEEDTPDAPTIHTLFSSTGGSGIQDIKWTLKNSGGQAIAFVDAHGNAYFQSLAAVNSIFTTSVVVEGDSTFGDDIANDVVNFNAVLQAPSLMQFLIDSNNDESGISYEFYHNTVNVANLLFEILDIGVARAQNDVTTQTNLLPYAVPSTSVVVAGVDASLNEVYDQTKTRNLLRPTPNNPADFIIDIATALITLSDDEEFGVINGGVLSSFTGGDINFSTGVVTGGANFTPFTPGASRFFKYGIGLLPDNTLSVIIPTTDFASLVAAKADTAEPSFSGLIPIAIIVVEDDGSGASGTIENIDEDQIARFIISGSGGEGSDIEVTDFTNRAEKTTIETRADVADDLDATFFIVSDNVGTVGFWIDVDDSGTGAPAGALAADRQVEITTIVTNDADTVVASKIQVVIDGDSKFSASVVTNVITVTDASDGERLDATEGDSGFTILTLLQGGSGLSGTIDGANDTFGMSATPKSQESVLVFLDGLKVANNDWNLSGQNIIFTVGAIPLGGQDLEVYYVKTS